MVDRRYGRFSTEPIYNIKAIVQKTGIPADTVRAWERRYGVPRPQRTETGRRLYSEHDIAAIRWLRERTAAGMTISQAIQQLQGLGEEAFVEPSPERDHGPRNPSALADELLIALLAFDETPASAIVGEAFALYPIEEVCLQIFSPVLIEIGERWHRKEATVAQEHFASHFIQRRLTSLLQAYAPTVGRGRIVTACAPDELHELGILMLSVFLVRHAWQVIYLGANVPIADLVQTCARLQPALICVSAMNPRTAQTLTAAVEAINQLPVPRPLVAFGGAPFNADVALRARVHGHFLGTDAQEGVARIEELLT
ncbi:MAG: Transcriptional regulator, MerR family [uncultured Thermomicrobiales bacterium]|uniref:Transcriptional regulator, MerR family n=1 Tax=uncultured Thermomicrobiales bacterium TaxID=1645740 RepID=A0A6J4VCJ1_9BACT|nr:MAG: Transcriptional regulator, MerR family [uncultured Thermomicrobiales bacterium]